MEALGLGLSAGRSVVTLPPLWFFDVEDLFTPLLLSGSPRGERAKAAGGSLSLSRYRLSLPGRAAGDRSTSLLSAPSVMLGRSSRSSPEVGIPQTCPPSCLRKTQTMSSVPTAAATLLPRWLNDTYPSVRPSRTAPHPRGGMTAEQAMAEPALLSSGG